MQTAIDLKKKLEQAFDPNQADVLSEVITEAYSDLVKTGDFNELKGIVKELAEAQKRTETKVGELVGAQKRTETRLEELTGSQKELAQAQKRTEEELRQLVAEHRITRRELGGLSNSLGYRLEDEAYRALPKLLKKDFGLVVRGRLKRQFIEDHEGKEIEVNIVGDAAKNGGRVTIIGESKSQLSKKGINEFTRKKLRRLEGVFKEIFPVLVTYMVSEPDVEDYAKSKGIALYYSYDF